ncbi:MAG: LysR family transcriptional regulator [Roseibium sp.]|uniref:LysR family transcriptional regulator n=1 Tax=Roseibium sp. TaxID=1936156 RepID=UPI00260E96A0|nr:LysR family transcriptional regulator [Roseibium sp.]MCV0428477.1 LysR family transcriptional regulator [Roseibium sp.]
MAAKPEISLKSLEVFRSCARCGSVTGAAKAMAISTSTVAHHLGLLEDQLDVALFDRTKKPLRLTAAGNAFLADLEPALAALRQATANANPQTMQFGRQLRFGTIEDFETEAVPDLAVFLSHSLPSVDFEYHVNPSLTLLEMMQNRMLDMCIMAKPTHPLANISYHPVLRDPFVLVVPKTCSYDAEQLLNGEADLPLLRFHGSQMIGKQIEAQLQRMKIQLRKHMLVGNNAILMALVAAGAGWAITTPLLYARSKRSQESVRLLRFPNQSSAREVGLFWSADCPLQLTELVKSKLHELVELYALGPVHQAYPWLKDEYVHISF